jgi:hypothetical protein
LLLATGGIQAGIVSHENLRVLGCEESGVPLPVVAVGEAEPLLAARLQRHAQADGAGGVRRQLRNACPVLLVDQNPRLDLGWKPCCGVQ